MRNLSFLIIVCFFFVGGVFADQKEPELIHQLGNRMKNRTYTSINSVYTLKIPDLGVQETVRIKDQERRSANSTNVIIIGEDDAVACVVATKIREGLPKDDSLLDRVQKKDEFLKNRFGDAIQFLDSKEQGNSKEEDSKPQRRYLQFTVANERYVKGAFPYGVATYKNNELKTMGVHRSFVRAGYLFEVIRIFSVQEDETESMARNRANRKMEEMLKKLTIKS